MKYLISEEEALYMDRHHGHFSRRLAEWAVSRMKKLGSDGELVPVTPRPLEELESLLRSNDVRLPEACVYDAWYLWHMCEADYPKSLEDSKHVARYIEETVCDPDGCPEMVLACFCAKMDLMGVPIHWERIL